MALTEQVAGWTAEAFRTLETARQISALAHASLGASSDTLTGEMPAKIAEAVAAFEKLLRQHALLVQIAKNVQADVLRCTDGHDKKVSGILQPALRDLDAVLATLHGISVPLFLVKTAASDRQTAHRLDDFVALADIGSLKTNIDIYLSNCAKVGCLLQKQVSGLLDNLGLKTADFKQLAAAYDAQVLPVKPLVKYASAEVPLNKGPETLVATILKENSALGLELSALLEMLTKHYDQCTLASSCVDGARDEPVDLDVLRGDTLELPSVLAEIRAIYDIILHNGRRAAAFSAQKIPPLAAFCDRCRVFLAACSDFQDNDVTELLLVLVHSQTVYSRSSLPAAPAESAGKLPSKESPVEGYAHMVRALGDHYHHFCSVYQLQYLSELHYEKFVYPRKYFKLLDEYLNGQLLRFENEERDRRREWLRRYGDFIPADFYLPGEADQPHVTQVASEGLDHLETPSAQDDEDRLVRLLKETQLLQEK
ncbi:hypothetical protein METBIDRAFT_12655 [Metschnikowia bicuspidata var. bicuspidata NRRL YB-4993]|uniref:Autophagy-related protein 17 n=1 Tax=Metschnikowia bicuspidata var. bicuspidata NRRL YB-4993 TaxID=869754 RepID=A0A1A0H9A4_9ASCO|nr:hypothetical protein METBIDRAFT_43806 [Metschnikowia bicuspidata var. bicuspidata NRRL YB-4993]XP_018711221.1 hypothetical protein METBIDRAFT_12655 [Metschnikowia bicuspidata var. bicuspidata NRRL YB-4993]OBA20695.1 hypothetical protein METBIDRAFT_43806 [Metschnikowia bicuspidata var. bicuspidata NRRL YB-4993]OBA20699.1 hypothetical protein METBIDRAFT_12655 [Metschnikowia bicuspidata var. bicuspidata NRRL YB-4993]